MRYAVAFLLLVLAGTIPAHFAMAVCSPGVPWKSSNGITCDRWEGYNTGTYCCSIIPVYVHDIPTEWDGEGSEDRFVTALGKALEAIIKGSGSQIDFTITNSSMYYGCYIPLAGHHIDVSADMNVGTGAGGCIVEPPTATGQIFRAVITMHLGLEIFNNDVDEDDALETTLMHELGHAIGMEHNDPSDNRVMKTPLDMDLLHIVLAEERWAADEKAAMVAVYTPRNKLQCLPMPAFLSSISITGGDSTGSYTSIRIATEFESNMSSVRIGYSDASAPADSDFAILGDVVLVNDPDGSSYTFDHNVSFPPGGKYLLRFINAQGQVENSIVVKGPSEGVVAGNSAGVLDMRTENFDSIVSNYWREVATGIRSVPTVDESAVDSGEYLVFAYNDFVADIAPICDYWESFAGVDVTLVSVDGEIDSASEIRNYISSANQNGLLEVIWLVGAPGVENEPQDWESICFVPTDFDYLDYYYADSGDFGSMEYAVGRLPAINNEEVVFYVNKELHYHKDTLWGGKKDPVLYSRQLVVSVPDDGHLPDPNSWDDNSWLMIANAENSLETIRVHSGLDPAGIDFLDVTQLAGFDDGVAAAQEAIGSALGQYLITGEHVVHGYAAHNSSSSQFGAISSVDWLDYTTLNDADHTYWRPCETFWIHPGCFSATAFCHTLYRNILTSLEAARLSVISHELFEAPGLLIFGAMGLSWSTTVEPLVPEITARIYADDSRYDRPKSIGVAWKETYNNVLSSSCVYPEGLETFGILGDPMLFIRRTYSPTSGTNDGQLTSLALSVYPSPFNSRVVFDLSGVRPGGGHLKVYDIRGRRVQDFVIDKRAAGNVQVLWDGRDMAGHTVASGVYIARIDNSGQIVTQRVALVR